MARGLTALPEVEPTIVVNVGDDESIHGLHVSPDLDTVIYTLGGVEGPEGWGRRDDSYRLNNELGRFGVDNRFLLGDLDLALNLFRTERLARGAALSEVTAQVAAGFGVDATVVPATNDPLRTMVRIDDGWITFQDYFVYRGNRDQVHELRYEGADEASPADGVIEAIDSASVVVIGPSNPPLSIWPILSIPGLREAVRDHPRVMAVSPLIGGRALKGPADRVMAGLGLPPGNEGVMAAYAGLLDVLVIDESDSRDVGGLSGVEVIATDTRIGSAEGAARLAKEILGL
jgi:LPPG:FO 2-phospho-L-lactate transferase